MSNMASWPPNCPKNQVWPSMTIPSSDSRQTPSLNLSNSPPEIVTILLQQQQLLNEMQSQLSTLVASSQLRSQDLAITSTSSISSTQASQSHKLITSSAGQKRLTMCIASDHNYAKKSCEEPAAVHFDSEELAGLNAMQVESGHGGEWCES